MNFKIIPAVSLLTLTAMHYANLSSAALRRVEPVLLPPAGTELAWMPDAAYEHAKELASERASRSISATLEVTDALLSPEFKSFRKNFLEVKTAEQLDAVFAEIEKNYAAYPNDLKLLAAQLAPLKALRSIVYRCRPIVQQTRLTQNSLVTLVKQAAAVAHVYFPTETWAAGLSYVTEPFEARVGVFKTEVDVQAFFVNELYPQLTLEAKRIQELNFQSAVIWDNQVFYGTASFKDDLDRYRTVSEAERSALLSTLHGGLARLSVLMAYHWTDMMKVTQDFGFVFGFDHNGLGIEGASAQDRTEAIRKYREFLVLKTERDAGKAWMARAYRHLREAARYSVITFKEVDGKPASAWAAVDPATVAPWSRQGKLNAATLEEIVRGATVVRSVVSGETMTVDLPRFYQEPPRDLKAFLPIGFQTGPKELTKIVAGDKGEVRLTYRNYQRGRAIAWDLDAYRKYYPDVKTADDVPRAARVLAQSWDGFLVGLPLSLLVL
ncbi:MAG: hypothetical protein HY074_14235 [Deltaproteobacteria bacterium]|nr:hypothetical protein [Deltaproteobacteria bacterium]